MRRLTKQQLEDSKQSHANVAEGTKSMFLHLMCVMLDRATEEGLTERVCFQRDALLKAYDMSVDNGISLASVVLESQTELET